MPIKIAGLDISKNAPGCVKLTLDDSTLDIAAVEFCGFTSVKKNEMSGINFFKKDDFKYSFDQTEYLNLKICEFVDDCSHVAFEDYAYGGSGDITGLAEFTGFIKYQIYKKNKKIRLYDIPSIKMHATSFGNADKLSMYNSFLKVNNVKPDISKMPVVDKGSGKSPTSDIIDAYFIADLLRTELIIRKGIKQLKDFNESTIKIFNRVTKANPTNILAQDFICK